MQRARIWGREVEMQGSPWTFLVYRRAFGGDLLSDLIAAEGKDPYELDDFLKFAWAMCATRDDSTPPMREWCDSFEGFTLADGEGAAFVSVVQNVLAAEMFRDRTPRLVRWWRNVRARWMGLLQKRRRAQETRLLA